MISSLASKCQDFKFEMPLFQLLYVMKLKTSTLKVLAFCCQWRYHYQIQITRSLYHKNQIFKHYWECLPSLPHSCPPKHRYFTSQKGKTAYTYETECTSKLITLIFKIKKVALLKCPCQSETYLKNNPFLLYICLVKNLIEKWLLLLPPPSVNKCPPLYLKHKTLQN